jgi:hypothetical protein
MAAIKNPISLGRRRYQIKNYPFGHSSTFAISSYAPHFPSVKQAPRYWRNPIGFGDTTFSN